MHSTLFRRHPLLEFARAHRREPTRSEHALWSVLKMRHVVGFRTKRQAIVGEWIADFLVPSVRLIVEVDGSVHEGRELADAQRTAGLARLGYSVMRLTADDGPRDPIPAALRVPAEVDRLRRPSP